MTTERLTKEETSKELEKILSDVKMEFICILDGKSKIWYLMQAFAAQEVEPIEKQRNELLEACKSSFKTLAAIGCNMEAEIIKVLETAIKNAER
jgi:hypothetical protein